MLYLLSQIDDGLAAEVAYCIGVHIPKSLDKPLNQIVPADADPEKYKSLNPEGSLTKSAALSMVNTPKDSIRTRKVAILAADGVNEKNVMALIDALTAKGAVGEVIAPKLGFIIGENNTELPIYKSFLTTASVLYDAVYVPGGTNSIATLEAEADAVHFLNEAFKHCKPIAADRSALQVLKATYFGRKLPEDENEKTAMMEGVVISNDIDTLVERFASAIAQHRFWEREKPRKVPA